MAWTRFMDMHSGGGTKEEPYEYIYIEAPEDVAMIVFWRRFGHNPERVSCTCCGEDYSISESATLEEATGYERGCEWSHDYKGYVDSPAAGDYRGKYYETLPKYLEREDVLVIRAEEIKPEEKVGELPRQGYIWCD